MVMLASILGHLGAHLYANPDAVPGVVLMAMFCCGAINIPKMADFGVFAVVLYGMYRCLPGFVLFWVYRLFLCLAVYIVACVLQEILIAARRQGHYSTRLVKLVVGSAETRGE